MTHPGTVAPPLPAGGFSRLWALIGLAVIGCSGDAAPGLGRPDGGGADAAADAVDETGGVDVAREQGQGDVGTPDAVADPDLAPDLSEPVVGLTIAYDYRFDTRGLFDSLEARAVLDEAARRWGVLLRDDFDDIPPGTDIYVRNPEDASIQEYLTLDVAIDDVLVFPGSAPRENSAAGASSTALFPAEEDDPELRAALMERWDGDDFEPWTAWMQFNSERIWFFDTTFATGDDIPDDATDALSTALHELGHILGIAPGGAFEQLIEDGHFVGPRAVEVYGGPVPLADAFGHIAEDVRIDGVQPVMATGRIRGQRYAITRLDVAMLADIGYEID